MRPDQTGTCAAQGNPKRTAAFRSSPRGLPLVAAAHFLNRPGRTAGLPLDNLVSASHFSVRLVLLFSYFQSIILTLHSCKKTMPCRAVLCYAMLCRRASADTEKGQVDPDGPPSTLVVQDRSVPAIIILRRSVAAQGFTDLLER